MNAIAKGMTAGAICMAVLGLACAANAQARSGREIAKAVCSACHDVGADQMFPPMLNRRIPGFREIANRPGVSARSLRRFVGRTHWDGGSIPMTMPNAMLEPDQTDAVVDYILSLRRAPQRRS